MHRDDQPGVVTGKVEIRLDMASMTEYDEPDLPLYSVFVGGKRVFSFQGSADGLHPGEETLASTGDRLDMSWGAGEGENWVERSGDVVVISRGRGPAVTMSNRVVDERVPLAEVPFMAWCEAVAHFASWAPPLPERTYTKEEYEDEEQGA